jgi:hypothetical protein
MSTKAELVITVVVKISILHPDKPLPQSQVLWVAINNPLLNSREFWYLIEYFFCFSFIK